LEIPGETSEALAYHDLAHWPILVEVRYFEGCGVVEVAATDDPILDQDREVVDVAEFVSVEVDCWVVFRAVAALAGKPDHQRNLEGAGFEFDVEMHFVHAEPILCVATLARVQEFAVAFGDLVPLVAF
jgi:hypothetical protein